MAANYIMTHDWLFILNENINYSPSAIIVYIGHVSTSKG